MNVNDEQCEAELARIDAVGGVTLTLDAKMFLRVVAVLQLGMKTPEMQNQVDYWHLVHWLRQVQAFVATESPNIARLIEQGFHE